LDVIEWALSGGKRPIKRPLPSQRLVRVTRHLRSAAGRLPQAPVSDADRPHLCRLMTAAPNASEEAPPHRFRPVLADAFLDSGLRTANPPEQTAFRKMVEELLDRLSTHGFLTFSDLRDTISRNNLKLPDVSDPQEFVRGDPLIRLDRRLASMLDGVYRPGEVYLRSLVRTTSLAFGTKAGRWLTRFVLIPFGGALLLLLGLENLADEYLGKTGVHLSFHPEWMFFPLGLLLLGLLYVPAVQEVADRAVRAVGRGLRRVFVDFPAWLLSFPVLKRIEGSWPFPPFYWSLFKPLVVVTVLRLVFPELVNTWLNYGMSLLAVSLALNARLGRAAGELVSQALSQFYGWLRAGLIPGVVQFTL